MSHSAWHRDGSAPVTHYFPCDFDCCHHNHSCRQIQAEGGSRELQTQVKAHLLGVQSGFVWAAAYAPGPGAQGSGNEILVPRQRGPAGRKSPALSLATRDQAQPGNQQRCPSTLIWVQILVWLTTISSAAQSSHEANVMIARHTWRNQGSEKLSNCASQ